jgi:hypothetical protein
MNIFLYSHVIEHGDVKRAFHAGLNLEQLTDWVLINDTIVCRMATTSTKKLVEKTSINHITEPIAIYITVRHECIQFLELMGIPNELAEEMLPMPPMPPLPELPELPETEPTQPAE